MIFSKIEGEGKAFLIIHGFLGMADNWKTLGTQFAESGYEVHILEMRNHGKSFHSDEFSYELMVQDVLEYCNHYGLKSTILLGHSMGGKVAMQFACDYSEYVEKLIIADIGPKYYPQHHQTILEGLNAIDFSLKPSRTEVDDIVSNYISDFGTRQFLLKSLYWVNKGQLAFRFNLKILSQKIEEIGKALPKKLVFNKETLFIRGGNSKYITQDDFLSIKEQFTHSKLETIQNAGHWLHAEQPKEFYDAVLNFLNKK